MITGCRLALQAAHAPPLGILTANLINECKDNQPDDAHNKRVCIGHEPIKAKNAHAGDDSRRYRLSRVPLYLEAHATTVTKAVEAERDREIRAGKVDRSAAARSI